MRRRISNTFAHGSIILSCTFLVFFCIDQMNPAMDFLGSALSKWPLFVFSLFALANGICSAILLFQRRRTHTHRAAPHTGGYPASTKNAEGSRERA
jgi:TRAP-type C4-dicarboxylate transport system permease small subunit